jgi:hypothetical protein
MIRPNIDMRVKFRLENGIYNAEQIPRGAREAIAGTLVEAAESLARRCHDSISENQVPEFAREKIHSKRRSGRFEINRRVRPLEEAALRAWALSSGLFLDEVDFTQKWRNQGKKGETEHQIYFDEESQRWFKRNNLSNHGNWLEYFHRVALHNWLFPEAPLLLEGFMEFEAEFQPVVSQPDVQAERGANAFEVENLMRELGFARVADKTRPFDFLNPSIGVEVNDLHDENVVVTPEGDLIVIDPVPMMDESSKLNRLAEEFGKE